MQGLDFKDVVSYFVSAKARKVPIYRLYLFVVQFRCSLLHNDTTTGIMPLLLLAYIWKCCHLDFGTGRNPLLIFVIDYR